MLRPQLNVLQRKPPKRLAFNNFGRFKGTRFETTISLLSRFSPAVAAATMAITTF
jgi:hypothetical protein